jgi:hypothetical protein
MAWSPHFYPATMEQLCVIARKKCMSVERLVSLYLQMACGHEQLMERETATNLLEEVLAKCILTGTKPCDGNSSPIAPNLDERPTGTDRL